MDGVVQEFTLPAGAVAKVNGIPVRLSHDTLATTHPANVPLVLKPQEPRQEANQPDVLEQLVRMNWRHLSDPDAPHVVEGGK